jgi:serine/threonine-protein kinase
VGVLGHGGMGTVLAGVRDEAGFVQRVAIKRLHAGSWSLHARERFLRERVILAGLEHPNIARLVDGGVDETGLPYFAMERIEGAPITEHCRVANLELPARLRLLEQICHAVEYAHARLVVHRDIKPANVLVTPAGQAKLLDFGIAKLLEEAPGDASLTATAAAVMTPAYAAPEQFQGQPITVATDVYQLGVLLYELLTERSPHGVPGSPLAMQRQVLEVEPERPSRAVPSNARQLAGDVDAIVMKALRKNPVERYASVEALRRDLEAYLESRPVVARRGTGVYRLRKYLHRHRVAAVASGMLVLSLSGGLVGVGVQARIAEHERDRARSAESRAEAIRDFLLEDLLKAPAPESSLGRPLTVAEVLDAASHSVGHAFRDIPGTEADVRLTLARTYASLGRTEEAERHAGEARRLLELAYGAGSTDVLRARTFLAELHDDAGRYAEAHAEIESVLAGQRAVLAPGDADVLASRRVLGRTLTLENQFFAAEAELRDALAIQERERPEDWRLGVELRGAIVDALIGRVAPPETEELCREILAIQERHLGPDHPDIATTLDRLSGVLQRKLRYEAALEVATRALDLRRRVQGEDHPLTGDAWSRVAIQHDRLHHTEQALDAARRAQAIFEASLGSNHPKTLEALHRVAIELRLSGRLDEAEPLYRTVLQGFERSLGQEHPSTLRVLSHLQMLLVADGRLAEARRVHARLREICERIVARPDTDPDMIDDYVDNLLTVDPPDLRDPWRALSLAERIVSETKRQVPHMLLNLGTGPARHRPTRSRKLHFAGGAGLAGRPALVDHGAGARGAPEPAGPRGRGDRPAHRSPRTAARGARRGRLRRRGNRAPARAAVRAARAAGRGRALVPRIARAVAELPSR